MYEYSYKILGITPPCSAAELRKRYLEMVKQFPPETNPEKFSQIHAAYEQLRNPFESLKKMLTEPELDDSIGAMITTLTEDIQKKRMPTPQLLAMGAAE